MMENEIIFIVGEIDTNNIIAAFTRKADAEALFKSSDPALGYYLKEVPLKNSALSSISYWRKTLYRTGPNMGLTTINRVSSHKYPELTIRSTTQEFSVVGYTREEVESLWGHLCP